MYTSYWGLNARPFDHRADAAFYYPAEGHQGALVKLRYALEHGCGAVLAGASGTGKTLVSDLLERQLAERGFDFRRLAFPLLTPDELLGYLADEFSEDEPALHHAARPSDQSLRRIENSLDRLVAQDKRPVIVVDEAQAIDDPRTLEALRLLMNLEGAKRPAPALLLVGQTRLLQTVLRMPSLEERMTAKCLLVAFSAEETAAYITHRMQAADRTLELFDASAMEAVHALAQGVPRRINRLCDLSLLVGYADERQIICAEHVEAVAEELINLDSSERPTHRSTADCHE